MLASHVLRELRRRLARVRQHIEDALPEALAEKKLVVERFAPDDDRLADDRRGRRDAQSRGSGERFRRVHAFGRERAVQIPEGKRVGFIGS